MTFCRYVHSSEDFSHFYKGTLNFDRAYKVVAVGIYENVAISL